jgi:serine/threonine-protein kinase
VLLREPPRRGRRGVAYLLLTAATLAVFVVALLVARSLLTGGSGELQTPAVVGQSEQDAQDVLNSDGLEVGQITYRYSNRVARGVVLGQNPEHPILLGRGQSVDLVVSKGVHLVTIPGDVLGQQASAATAELTHLGFVVKSVDVPSRQPLGQVTNAAPAAGTQVAIGSTVTLSVSNARQTVPGVVDLDATVAELRLRRAGFAVEERNASTYSKSTPIGTVVVQAPTTGSYAVVGSTVVIYVNNPLPPPSTPARHSSAPATSSSNTSPARSTPPASSSAPPTTPASSTPPATSSRPR